MRPLTRRLLPLATLLAVVGTFLSCDDTTDPGTPRATLRLSLASASGIAQSLRAVVRGADNAVLVDTTVALTAGQDTVDLTLGVPLTSGGETVTVTMELLNAAGGVIFTSEPITVPLTPGGTADVPDVPLRYVGVGADAASVLILTPDVLLEAGAERRLTAVALDSAGDSIPGTPIRWRTTDTTRARFPSRDSSRVVATTVTGPFLIIAQLFTGQADTVPGEIVGPLTGTLAAARDSLEEALFRLITQAFDDSLGTRQEAVDWSALDGISFEGARQLYEQALATNPQSNTAAFGLALTTLLVLEGNTAIRTTLEDIDTWAAVNSGDSLFEGSGPYPPTPAQIQSVIQSDLEPALLTALNALNTVDSAGFTFTITSRMQGAAPGVEPARELDLTEILFLRALLEGALAFVDAALAYQWTPDPYGPAGFDAAMAPGSTFLTLAGGGGARLAGAQTRLQTGVTHVLAALDFLEAETDNQSDDLVRFDASGQSCCFNDPFSDSLTAADVADARRVLTDVQAALSGPRTFNEDFGRGMVSVVIDFTRLLVAPVNDLKALLPPYQASNGRFNWQALAFDEWLFPDPTFNNMLPGIPDSDSLKQIFDLEGMYDDGKFQIDNWVGLTMSPLDGDLYVLTERGDTRELPAGFATIESRPDLPPDSFMFVDALGTSVANGLLVASFGGQVFTRPDDVGTAWTDRMLFVGCGARGIAEHPVTTGAIFMMDFCGQLWEVPGDFSQALLRPSVFGSINGFIARPGTADLVALSWDGFLYTLGALDTLGTWAQAPLTLPFVDFDDEWVGLAVDAQTGTMYAVQRRGNFVEIPQDFETATTRPAVGATDIWKLVVNPQTGDLVAMTRDGRVFTRPRDVGTPWTLRTTLPRTILPQQ